MAIRWKHDDSTILYFGTFTCYNWLPLIEKVNGYDMVYKWFDLLRDQGHGTVAYVIMPNHVHTIHYFPEPGFNLHKIIGNAKGFMAYEIIKRFEHSNYLDTLNYLGSVVSEREKKKGQLHKVFTDSFDANVIYNEKFLNQKVKYIHRNPVSGKWKLAIDYSDYEHSSASFYESDVVINYKLFHSKLH